MQTADSATAPKFPDGQIGNSHEDEPSLYRPGAEYWDRYDRLVSAMHVTDRAPKGPEKDAADQEQSARGTHLDDATFAVLEHAPTWLVDARIKANFVEGLVDRNGGNLSSDELAALLSSLPVLTCKPKGGEA